MSPTPRSKKPTPTPVAASVQVPASLKQQVKGEPAALSRARASLVDQWPLTNREPALLAERVAVQLFALGRSVEALDLAASVHASIPDAERPRDVLWFWTSAATAAAVTAAIRADDAGRKTLAAMFHHQRWEDDTPEALRQTAQFSFHQAFNGRHYEAEPDAEAIDRLSLALARALPWQQLSRVAVYRAAFSRKVIDQLVTALTDTLRWRLEGGVPTAPKGLEPQPKANADLRWSVPFDRQAFFEPKQREATCPHCQAEVELTQCVACPTWFVQKPRSTEVACDPRRDAAQRRCPKCKGEVVPPGVAP